MTIKLANLIFLTANFLLEGMTGVLANDFSNSRLTSILASGELHAGTRAFAPPFAVRQDNGEFSGFSVDILKIITESLSQRFDKKLNLKISEVTSGNRIPAVSSGDVDIVCGLTTVTWPREKTIDFSVPFFVDGTRILVRRGKTTKSLNSLRGASVGVVGSTTTADILKNSLKDVELVVFENFDKAMQSFVAGRIDGVANIGVFLANKQKENGGEFSMEIIPRDRSLKSENLACILPQDDSIFRDAVNFALTQSFKDIDSFGGQYMDIYLKWFGRDGTVNFPISEEHRALLTGSRIWID